MTEHIVAISPHEADLASNRIGAKLNWLRAGVLGANDGIVSVAGVAIGVSAAAPGNIAAIATAGIAALAAGAFAMAGGEYVSVSTQRDTERALLEQKRKDLTAQPAAELAALAGIYRGKGLSADIARRVAEELTEKDALAAHAEVRLGIDADELTSPTHAAVSSFIAFFLGALLPLIAILLPIGSLAVWATFAAVVLALVMTGWLSASLGGAPRRPAIWRNVLMGAATMAATYFIGHLFGVAIS